MWDHEGHSVQLRLKGLSVQQTPGGLRERKRISTRRALEDAALELFSRKGFSRTTIDEIALRAEVSRSTFFRYFGSKDSVLFSPDDEAALEFLELIRSRPLEEGPLVAFERALLLLAAGGTARFDRGVARAREDLITKDPYLRARRAEHLTRWTETFARTLADRDGAREPDTAHRLASWVGLAVVQEMGEEWRRAVDEPDSVQLVRDHFAVLRGLLENLHAPADVVPLSRGEPG
jgi:AcrR family transcriptional regulator